jgi:cytochrome c peroxidase
MRFLQFLPGTFSLLLLPIIVLTQKPESKPIELAENCPPGFELTGDNRCVSRSLYQQYQSLRNSGVGGLKTGLPKVRDGFSPQQIDLGRYLFFDPILSRDGSLSCASCHNPELGFSDGMTHSVGINGKEGSRNAPTLWNVSFMKSFFWDARAKTLEEQMEGPLFAPHEMGTTPNQLLSTLNSLPVYQRLFAQAFPDRTDEKNQVEGNLYGPDGF